MLKVKKILTMSTITDLLTMVHQVPRDPFSTCFLNSTLSHPPEVIAPLAPKLDVPKAWKPDLMCVLTDSFY